MAYYEKASSREIARFAIALVLLFIAIGSFGYLITRFGTNPMALRNSVTWEEIINPNAEVELTQPKREAGQVAGEKDQKKPVYAIQPMNPSSVKAGENLVEMARIQNVPFLRFNNNLGAPQSGFDISAIDLSDAANYPWKPLFNAPAGKFEMFSYYASQDTANQVIVLKWGDTPSRYTVYVYNEFDKENPVRLVNTFNEDSSQPSVPRAMGVSPDGRFIALGMYTCADCQNEIPVTFMIDSKEGYVQNIGKTSQIAWGQGGQFQYKEYKEADCPDPTQSSKCTLDPQFLPFKSGSVLP